MKIKIITIHNVENNFGSTIQSCSMCEFLNEIGFDTELIDYIPNYKNKFGRLITLIVNLLFFPYYLKRKLNFIKYYQEHARLTKRYTNFSQLNRTPPLADVYITGSDQVWNPYFPCGQDDAYYLKFSKGTNKMSYASSMGRLLETEDLISLKEKIRDYKHISIREKKSCDQLKSIGIDNATHVLDPVFFYKKEYYQKNLRPNQFGRYLLIYAINPDDLLENIAKEIAQKNNLKIILIGGFRKKCMCDTFLRAAGPNDFLQLLNHAQFILTSSFHGVALSIILNKPFAVIKPRINFLRIENILKTAGITNRLIKNTDDLQKLSNQIDYDQVNFNIDSMRKESIEFLVKSLEHFVKANDIINRT